MTDGLAAGRAALAALDAALAGRPDKGGPAFAAATEHLCVLRDGMIGRLRAGGATAEARQALNRVNAVLTVVLAGHFPLGPVPWDEVAAARGWLAGVVGEAVQVTPGG